MINNRQGGGRRRGRGGQRGQNTGGQPGNRQDNRQRGNAAQLLEKYKNMARDSQLAGDRVQTEYYLQFADHYFRILSETRARFEEQNPRRQRDEDYDDEEDGDEELADAGDEQSAELDEPRRDRGGERSDRGDRGERGERFNRRSRERGARDDRQGDAVGADERPARGNGGGETIPFDILPPAIARDEAAVADEEDAPAEQRRPRRRTRAPRSSEGDGEIAPAA